MTTTRAKISPLARVGVLGISVKTNTKKTTLHWTALTPYLPASELMGIVVMRTWPKRTTVIWKLILHTPLISPRSTTIQLMRIPIFKR